MIPLYRMPGETLKAVSTIHLNSPQFTPQNNTQHVHRINIVLQQGRNFHLQISAHGWR